MKWTVNWQAYYDAEGPKEITKYDPIRLGLGLVDPKVLLGKRIIGYEVDRYGELVFETED